MRYFAFLKAINVGGSHVVTMDRLRAIFTAMGLPGAETFIASGNVILESKARDIRALERKIAGGLEQALGYAVPVFLRSAPEVAAICAYEPFPAKAMAAATVVSVGFMAQPLDAEAVTVMKSYNTPDDSFHTHGHEFYWMSRTKQSESPFFRVRFERVFHTEVTLRNLTTVRKLAAKYAIDG